MVDISATIEDNCFDTFFFCTFGHELTDSFGRIDVPALLSLERLIKSAGGNQGIGGSVVDYLSVDMLVGAVYAKSRTLSGTLDTTTNASVASDSVCLSVLLVNHFDLVLLPFVSPND